MRRKDEWVDSWDKYAKLVFDKFESFEKKIDSIGTDVKGVTDGTSKEISNLKVQLAILNTRVWGISVVASAVVGGIVSWLVKRL